MSKSFFISDLAEIIPLHTLNRNSNSSLSHPIWNLLPRNTKEWKYVEFHLDLPPLYVINSLNKSIIIDDKTYSISEGYNYKNNDEIIKAFNDQISIDGFNMTLDTNTNFITVSHATTNFTITKNNYLNFNDCDDDKTYTSYKGFDITENLTYICSDFSNYLNPTTSSQQRESFLPIDLLFSTINPSVAARYPVTSNLFSIKNNFNDLRSISFSLRNPSNSHVDIPIYQDWSIIIKVYR